MFRMIALTVAVVLITPQISYAYKVTTLYRFTDKSDGGNPVGGVVQDASGAIYGETYEGGGYVCPNPPYKNQGCGTVYAFSPTTGFKLLATFTGANGGHGNITPVLVGNTLYGATAAGGANNDGVIFSVNTDGTNFTILHQFAGADGADPNTLVADASGTLYGTTNTGGPNKDGVLFSLTPSGTYTMLHNFTLPVSGFPNALIVAANGTMVGSTSSGGKPSQACLYGCGTIFEYTEPAGKFITLGTFPSSGLQGYTPYIGSFGPGPTAYASSFTTSIFSISPKNGFTNLADLNYYTVGTYAYSGPVYTKSGILYGVLTENQFTGNGMIYGLQNGVITDYYVFEGTFGRSGAGPIAKPTVTGSGSLLGTTSSSGNCNYCGTIWEFTP